MEVSCPSTFDGVPVNGFVLPQISGNGTYENEWRIDEYGNARIWQSGQWKASTSSGFGWGVVAVGDDTATATKAMDTIKYLSGMGAKLTLLPATESDPLRLEFLVNGDHINFIPERTLYVAEAWNAGGIENECATHYISIEEALGYISGLNTTDSWTIYVYQGTYSETVTIPPNITIICASGARFSDCIITLIQGARFLGYGDIINSGNAFIQVVATTLDESTITTVEGLTLAIHTVGVPLHIRCNTLTTLKATITNDYNNITPIISKLDIKVECLDIIRIITTSVPFSQLNSYRQLPYLSNNLYCQCAWKNGIPECNQASKCLMTWSEIGSSNYRTAEISRITVRTNTRNPYSEFFISVGKISVFGLEHENVIETPANYITSSTYGSEDVPRTQLNIHGFRESYSSLGTAYQVANEGTLIIDSCNIRAVNGGARVVYQKIYDTTYTCRTSVKNSYIEGGGRDIESATSDRLAVNSSIGCSGEYGSTIILGAWYTSVGINWI